MKIELTTCLYIASKDALDRKRIVDGLRYPVVFTSFCGREYAFNKGEFPLVDLPCACGASNCFLVKHKELD